MPHFMNSYGLGKIDAHLSKHVAAKDLLSKALFQSTAEENVIWPELRVRLLQLVQVVYNPCSKA